MSAFPVELLKGHDNSPNGFPELAYVKLPLWLGKKICGKSWKKEDNDHILFQVVEETDKAYHLLFCKDSSMSYDFVRPTWYLEWVSKSVVELIRTDVKEYLKETQEYYEKKWSK